MSASEQDPFLQGDVVQVRDGQGPPDQAIGVAAEAVDPQFPGGHQTNSAGMQQTNNETETTKRRMALSETERAAFEWAKRTFPGLPVSAYDLKVGVRILSLDGGGIKGIAECAVLAKIEEEIGKPIHELFDLVVGTSAGAIIALGITRQKLEATRIIEIFKMLSSDIFAGSGSLNKLLNTGSRFDDSSLVMNLKKHLTDEHSKGEYTNCCVTACNATHGNVQNREFLFQFYDSKFKHCSNIKGVQCWQAARASAAAPSYLPGYSMRLAINASCNSKLTEEDVILVDGGILNNNPVEVAITQARKELWPGHEIECIVSLSCGNDNVYGDGSGAERYSHLVFAVQEADQETPQPIASASSLDPGFLSWMKYGRHLSTLLNRMERLAAPVEPVHQRTLIALNTGHYDGAIKRNAYTRIDPFIKDVSRIALSDSSKTDVVDEGARAWLHLNDEGKQACARVVEILAAPRSLGLIETFREYLKRWYLANYATARIFNNDKFTWPMGDVSINLSRSIVGGIEENIECAELLAVLLKNCKQAEPDADSSVEGSARNSEQSMNGKPAFQRIKTTLVEADAGFGKTTLTKRLCYLWASASEALPKIELLICVNFNRALTILSKTRLMEIMDAEKITLTTEEKITLFAVCAMAKIMNAQSPDADYMQTAVAVLIGLKTGAIRSGEFVLIFDGLDEATSEDQQKWFSLQRDICNAHDSPAHTDIDQRHSGAKVASSAAVESTNCSRICLLLTSRPGSEIHASIAKSSVFRIAALDSEYSKTSFIQKFCTHLSRSFANEANEERLAESLKELITAPNLSRLFSSPLLLLMGCVVAAVEYFSYLEQSEIEQSAEERQGSVSNMPILELFDAFCELQYAHHKSETMFVVSSAKWKQQPLMRWLQEFAALEFTYCPFRQQSVTISRSYAKFKFVGMAAAIGVLSITSLNNKDIMVSFQHDLFRQYFARLYRNRFDDIAFSTDCLLPPITDMAQICLELKQDDFCEAIQNNYRVQLADDSFASLEKSKLYLPSGFTHALLLLKTEHLRALSAGNGKKDEKSCYSELSKGAQDLIDLVSDQAPFQGYRLIMHRVHFT